MSKLGVVLAVVALAVGGFGLMQLCEKDSQIENLQQANQELQDRLTGLETQMSEALAPGESRELMAADGPAADGTSPGGAPALAGRAASPLSRLAYLEKRVAEQDQAFAKLKEKEAAEKAHGSMQNFSRSFANNGFYGNMDMAAKAMDLKDNQKSDMQELIDRARQELDDLYKLENDEGVTWNEVRKPKMVEGNGISFAMPDMAKLRKFKKGRIPGSSETFGEAEKRIRKDAFGRMRNVLTAEQAEKWDKAHKDTLLRGGGSGMVSAVSFVGLGGDD